MERLEALTKRVDEIEKHLGVKTMYELCRAIHEEIGFEDLNNAVTAFKIAKKLVNEGYCVLKKPQQPKEN